MNILLKREWKKLKNDIELEKEKLEPLILVRIILDWSEKFQNYKDIKIKNEYIDYISYFQKLEIKEYDFKEKWYNFDNLLESLKLRIDRDTDRLITVLYEVLTEILIFKSNIVGEIEPYYYRVYTDYRKEKIYYISDLGSPTLDINLNQIKLEENVIPAPAFLIEKYGIEVCQEFEDYNVI